MKIASHKHQRTVIVSFLGIVQTVAMIVKNKISNGGSRVVPMILVIGIATIAVDMV